MNPISSTPAAVSSPLFTPAAPAVDRAVLEVAEVSETPEQPSTSSVAGNVAKNSEPVISAQGTLLSGLFATADEFIRKEHLVPYQRLCYDSYGHMKDYEGAYIDVGKYNNYLFDKAASGLVAQAKEQGFDLDKKEVIAQLKASNSDIASMKLDNQDRRDRLGVLNCLTTLSWTDLQELTDMYIAAKENGLDTNMVWSMASSKGSHLTHLSESYYVWPALDPEEMPNAVREAMDSIRAKLAESFNLGMDFFNWKNSSGSGADFLTYMLHPAMSYMENQHRMDFLDFLSKLIDLKNEGKFHYASE